MYLHSGAWCSVSTRATGMPAVSHPNLRRHSFLAPASTDDSSRRGRVSSTSVTVPRRHTVSRPESCHTCSNDTNTHPVAQAIPNLKLTPVAPASEKPARRGSAHTPRAPALGMCLSMRAGDVRDLPARVLGKTHQPKPPKARVPRPVRPCLAGTTGPLPQLSVLTEARTEGDTAMPESVVGGFWGRRGVHRVSPPGGAWPGVCRGKCCSACAAAEGAVRARCSGRGGGGNAS